MEHHPREVAIPAQAFDHLRAALAQEADEAAGVRVLHAAGFSTGEGIYEMLGAAGDPLALGTGRFWSRLAEVFGDRGWGSLSHEARHPGVSVLVSGDWAEATERADDHPTCAFTTGMLSYVLTRVAGAPVAVLETSCRARGDRRCEFAFGSERTVQSLYAGLLDGASLDDALAGL